MHTEGEKTHAKTETKKSHGLCFDIKFYLHHNYSDSTFSSGSRILQPIKTNFDYR